MARKGILSPDIGTQKPPETPGRLIPRGAVGALQSSLARIQENAVQEIDTALVDDAGFEDRLGFEPAAQSQLKESLKTYGQQVPVLLRPHPKKPGRYEIVYGRRRLSALKELGQPVKAMVRQLDDHALVMAQGQENTSRQDLSFIEKASFAWQLQEAGYDRPTIAAALAIDMPMLSRMLKTGGAFDLPFLRQIGSAPSIGRERWMALAKLFEIPGAASSAKAFMRGPDFPRFNSDGRFEAVFARAKRVAEQGTTPPAPPKSRKLNGKDGAVLADIKTTARAVTLSIPAREEGDFGRWLDANAEALLNDLHDRWMKERSEE